MTVSLWEGVVKTCADQYFEHCRNNGGTIKHGFLKDLVQQTNEKTGGHSDTKHDDIKNAIKTIKIEKKKIENHQSRQVSPNDLSDSSLSMIEIYTKRALAHRGVKPFNRATLDGPKILAKAPDNVQKEWAGVLCARGIASLAAIPVPPTKRDLLTTGSRMYAGGLALVDYYKVNEYY